MNDTQYSPPPGATGPGPDDEFDPQRLRSITDMQRSDRGRVVAGVCAGAARYLGIDPIVVRVVLAVLSLAGGAGIIIYGAAWLLLPAEGESTSIAADWFKLDKNEESVRVGGLVAAVMLAALVMVGNSSWGWWGGSSWGLVPLALLAYVFWLRPKRRREAQAEAQADAGATAYLADDHDPAAVIDPARTIAAPRHPVKKARERRSPALLGLTASLMAIALAALWIYDETQKNVPWTAYIALALAVVGVGLLIGTFFGHGGWLIGIGVVLALTLAIGSVFPSGRIGEQLATPQTAADVDTTYEHGIGYLRLDLTGVSDPERLLGRSITLDAGIGHTLVIVPAGLNVDVRADMQAGQTSLFGREDDGTDFSMTDTADRPTDPSLTIDINQKLGYIEVITP